MVIDGFKVAWRNEAYFESWEGIYVRSWAKKVKKVTA